MGNARLAIVGSRDFKDFDQLSEICKDLVEMYNITEVVSGGARGADKLGAEFAKLSKLKLTEYLPDWQKYSRMAGYLRNITIVDNAEILVAFWDGKSKGTRHSISLAKDKGIPTYVFNYVKSEIASYNDYK